MDTFLFRIYIRNIFLPLYPHISKEYVIENGKVIKGSVFFKINSSPRRFKKDMEHLIFGGNEYWINYNLITSKWDKYLY